VSGPRGVPDSQLSATSEYDFATNTSRARLHYYDGSIQAGSWSPLVCNTEQYIQVSKYYIYL